MPFGMSDSTSSPFESLRYRPYSWFLIGGFTLFIANQIQMVVLGWQIYSLTQNPLSLGLIGLSEALPFLSLTLVGGYLADRWDRKTQCLISLVPILGGAVLLVVDNWTSPTQHVWVFYLAQALGGVGRAFFRPAYQALAADLVPKESYVNASTMRSSTFHISMVIGPVLGGFLIPLGYRAAYTSVGLLVLCTMIAYLKIQPLVRFKREDSDQTRFFDGVRFVFTEKIVLGALTLDLFAVLFGGATSLLPIFARDILQVGEKGFGLLRSAPALGSIMMSLWLTFYPPVRHMGRWLLTCVFIFGLGWIAFALSQSFILSLMILVICGAADNVSVIMRSALVQTQTPRHLMGRVGAVNSFFIGSSNEIGAFESGMAAKLIGVVPSVVFGGLMTLTTVGTVAWKIPALRKLDRLEDAQS
jgi:MFS family permease